MYFIDSIALVETKGLETAAILAALYNAASPITQFAHDPKYDTITLQQAEEVLMSQTGFYVDYLHGKRMKLSLGRAEESGIDAQQFEVYQGRGLARAAIDILRRTGDPCHPDIIALQQYSKAHMAEMCRPNPRAGESEETTLAEAMGLTDRSTPDEPDLVYAQYANTPCTTYHL